MSTFPFLTADGFDSACQAFVRRVDAVGGAQDLGWLGVEYMTSEVGVQWHENSYFPLRICIIAPLKAQLARQLSWQRCTDSY
jgi:hypothetical protein